MDKIFRGSDDTIWLRDNEPPPEGTTWWNAAEDLECKNCGHIVKDLESFIGNLDGDPVVLYCQSCFFTTDYDSEPEHKTPDPQEYHVPSLDWVQMRDGNCYFCRTRDCDHLRRR